MAKASEEADTPIAWMATGPETRRMSGVLVTAFRRSMHLSEWTGAFRPAIYLHRGSAGFGIPIVLQAISRHPARAGNCVSGFHPELSWSEASPPLSLEGDEDCEITLASWLARLNEALARGSFQTAAAARTSGLC